MSAQTCHSPMYECHFGYCADLFLVYDREDNINGISWSTRGIGSVLQFTVVHVTFVCVKYFVSIHIYIYIYILRVKF